MPGRPALRRLAEAAGILPEYTDLTGVVRVTSDDTRVALLAALDLDASTEDAAARSLGQLERAAHRRALGPVIVQRQGDPGSSTLELRGLRDLSSDSVEYLLELEEENGERHRCEGRISLRGKSKARLDLPASPPPGYHRVRVELGTGATGRSDESLWVLTPRTCATVKQLLNDERRYGIWTHLYTLRSPQNWGVGDLGDLRELVRWADEIGASFVGLNPLHALANRGVHVSPYGPLSRLFHNPLYIDVEAIPELAACPEARAHIDSPNFRTKLEALRRAAWVDYEAVMALKLPVLSMLHRVFLDQQRARAGARVQAYSEFLEQKGEALTAFATFCALLDNFSARGQGDWHSWPAKFRDPHSADVERFRTEHRETFDRHRYFQFEIHRQLSAAAGAAPLPLGLYGDLAIGSSLSGSDPWAYPDLFVEGAYLGAPPDEYSVAGQDWGLPPLNPFQLREDGYRYWIQLLRSGLAQMGALRIDHVMGLFRQYWVVADRPAAEGAYVRYPARDLLGILALESQRHRALVIGEDLGTVPSGLSAQLARWGILSSRVLYFQRDRLGRFRPSRSYSKRALVTVNTHDHAPLAGYWNGRDLELRQRLGDLASAKSAAEAHAQRDRERGNLLRRLEIEGCLKPSPRPVSTAQLTAAVHRFVAHTPSPLVGVWLDDLAGETDPLNLPGVEPDRYPLWSRRQRKDYADLQDDADVERTLAALAERRPTR